MDEDKSSDLDRLREELEEGERRLDEKRRRIQALGQERLQRAATTYDTDREADEQDIKNKELALEESKKALQVAIEHKEARKRQHEAHVQSLLNEVQGLKRFKPSDVGLPSEVSHPPASSTPAFNTRQCALEKPIEAQPEQDDVCRSSHVDEPLGEESAARDGTLAAPGSVSSAQSPSQNLSLTNKTIAFDEVYRLAQDPDAKYKHWIIEKGGNWYIIRCAEHHLNWGKDPVRSAKLHLTSKFHGSSNRENLAIEELGELVEGCDQDKARLSNDEYQKSLKEGYIPNNTMKKPQEALVKPITRSAQDPSKGVTNPVVGEVYQGWWDSSPVRGWFWVVILPFLGDGDWKEVGITGALSSSALRNDIPKCFKKVKGDSGEEVLKLVWAEGYEDHGRKVCLRKFPCLFLHPPLSIPPADQDLRLEDIPESEVLTFQAARDLRHPPSILPEELETIGVTAYKYLAHNWEARLGTIRANQDPAPGQRSVRTGSSQAAPSKDRQHPATTTATTGIGSSRSPSITGVSQYGSGSNIPKSGGGFNPCRNGLPAPSTLGRPLSYSPAGSRPTPGFYKSIEDSRSTFRPSGRPASFHAPVPYSQEMRAEAAGPEGWRQNTMYSQGPREQDGTLRRGNSADAMEGDVVPEDAKLPGRFPTQSHFDDLGGARRSTDERQSNASAGNDRQTWFEG